MAHPKCSALRDRRQADASTDARSLPLLGAERLGRVESPAGSHRARSAPGLAARLTRRYRRDARREFAWRAFVRSRSSAQQWEIITTGLGRTWTNLVAAICRAGRQHHQQVPAAIELEIHAPARDTNARCRGGGRRFRTASIPRAPRGGGGALASERRRVAGATSVTGLAPACAPPRYWGGTGRAVAPGTGAAALAGCRSLARRAAAAIIDLGFHVGSTGAAGMAPDCRSHPGGPLGPPRAVLTRRPGTRRGSALRRSASTLSFAHTRNAR